jgi:hypothetical protein
MFIFQKWLYKFDIFAILLEKIHAYMFYSINTILNLL